VNYHIHSYQCFTYSIPYPQCSDRPHLTDHSKIYGAYSSLLDVTQDYGMDVTQDYGMITANSQMCKYSECAHIGWADVWILLIT